MKRGEVYWVSTRLSLRGRKGSYYVIVSRDFVVRNPDIETVICSPIYSRWLGLESEVPISRNEGVDHDSAVRCDMTTLLHKSQLHRRIGTLGPDKIAQLDRALATALGIGSIERPTRQ